MKAEDVAVLLQTLGERAQGQGIDSLDEVERTALVPYWALGIIGNGGFGYFLRGKYPLADVARRLRALGFGAAADACERVLAALFPDGIERPGALADRGNEIEWGRFRSEERVLFAVTVEELLRTIGGFVEAHRASFRDLGPKQ